MIFFFLFEILHLIVLVEHILAVALLWMNTYDIYEIPKIAVSVFQTDYCL